MWGFCRFCCCCCCRTVRYILVLNGQWLVAAVWTMVVAFLSSSMHNNALNLLTYFCLILLLSFTMRDHNCAVPIDLSEVGFCSLDCRLQWNDIFKRENLACHYCRYTKNYYFPMFCFDGAVSLPSLSVYHSFHSILFHSISFLFRLLLSIEEENSSVNE